MVMWIKYIFEKNIFIFYKSSKIQILKKILKLKTFYGIKFHHTREYYLKQTDLNKPAFIYTLCLVL